MHYVHMPTPHNYILQTYTNKILLKCTWNMTVSKLKALKVSQPFRIYWMGDSSSQNIVS